MPRVSIIRQFFNFWYLITRSFIHLRFINFARLIPTLKIVMDIICINMSRLLALYLRISIYFAPTLFMHNIRLWYLYFPE